MSEAAQRRKREPRAPSGSRARLNRFRRHRRLRRAAPRLYGGPPDPPAPFIGGATRSGTTLLRLMLDAHPEVAIPSETHFVPDVIARCVEGPVTADELAAIVTGHRRWGDFGLDAGELRGALAALEPLTAAEAIRAFFRLYAREQGKARWGDKTPGYIRKTQPIQRVLPRGALHPHDPRRPRRRALGAPPQLRALDRHRGGRAVGEARRRPAGARRTPRPLHGGHLRGPDRSTPRRRCGGSASSSTSSSTPRCSPTTSAPRSG